MDKSIMPECYADTLLIETLVSSKNGYNHKHGCFEIEAEMVNGKLKDEFALGIIDNDKIQIKYLREFKVIDKIEGSLILWRHKDNRKHHFVIQICPALEKWILNICATEVINLGDFELNKDLNGLKAYSKSRSSMKEDRLIRLFKVISGKSNNLNVEKLRHWIKELKEKNYKVDINTLING